MNQLDAHNTEVSEPQMVQYLLGEMSETEQEEFEARYFADDELFERLTMVKAGLLDDYVRGRLTSQMHTQLERRLADSAPRQAEAAFARTLNETLQHESLPDHEAVHDLAKNFSIPWWQSYRWRLAGAVVATVVVLAGCSWLFYENRQLRHELDRLQTERAAQAQREQSLQAELAALRQTIIPTTPAPIPSVSPAISPSPIVPRPDESLLAFNLNPPARAPNDKPVLTLTPAARIVRVRLALNFVPAARSCSVELLRADEISVKQQIGLSAREEKSGFFLTMQLPASALTTGAYKFKVTGRDVERRNDVLLTYDFRVVRP